MKALFRCEKNWQKINVQRFSANFLFSKNGKCRSITYSGDFATLPFCKKNGFTENFFSAKPSTLHIFIYGIQCKQQYVFIRQIIKPVCVS